MPSITINGPVVPADVENEVLRDALFHSPVQRLANPYSYHVIEIGIREGAYTSWIGTWDQSDQKVDGGTPTSILDTARLGMRLRGGQAIVVRLTATGSPESINGSRINFRLGLVGGRDGPAKALVSSGVTITDTNSRVALAALERQINTGGLADWDDSVQLVDPIALGSVGAFQGRLQLDSSTQISIHRYGGNWIDVDGELVSLGTLGLTTTTTSGLLDATGSITSTAPSSSTLYYAYVGSLGLRLCATAPSLYLGTYYLGSTEAARRWRFAGWVFAGQGPIFTDSDIAREVVNYYNREAKRLFRCPAYSDGNAQTTYTQSSTTFAKLNGGSGSDVSWISNGEDGVFLTATYRAVLSTADVHGPAIGIDGITDIEVAGTCLQVGSERVHISIPRYYVASSAGRHTASILGRQASGVATVYADVARNGAAADPAETYLAGMVMA